MSQIVTEIPNREPDFTYKIGGTILHNTWQIDDRTIVQQRRNILETLCAPEPREGEGVIYTSIGQIQL